MTRRSKLLGLALTMVFALSAVAASAASADSTPFTAEVESGETAKVNGGQTEGFGDTFTLTSNENQLSCEVATLSGEAAGSGPSIEKVRLHPKYENCHVIAFGFITLPATVTPHDCEYVLSATKNTTDTESNPTEYSAELEITCPVGQQIVIHVYENATKHANDEPLCVYDIGKQTVNHHIQLTNHENSPDDVIAHITELPLVMDNTKQSALCSEETHPEVTYNGEDTLTAEDQEGNPVDFLVG